MANAMSRALHWAVDGAAPGQREAYCAYAKLQQQTGEQWDDVGIFALGLYQLAKAPGSLRIQKFEDAFIARKTLENADYVFEHEHLMDQTDPTLRSVFKEFYPEIHHYRSDTLTNIYNTLYHASGVQKSAFELALIPTMDPLVVQDIVAEEYRWQNLNGLIPQEAFKLRLGEWLGGINKAGFRLKEGTGYRGFKVTIDNPEPTLRENMIHYAMSWIATLTTLTGVVLTVSAAATPLAGVIAGIATYLALEAAHQFSTFDLAEWLIRDLRWALSDRFMSRDQFSLKETIKTGFFIGALSMLGVLAAQATFASVFAFPLLAATLNPMVLTGIAAVTSAWAFATTLIGLSLPIRYVRGISFHSNEVSTEELQQAVCSPVCSNVDYWLKDYRYAHNVKDLNTLLDLKADNDSDWTEEADSVSVPKSPLIVRSLSASLSSESSEEKNQAEILPKAKLK